MNEKEEKVRILLLTITTRIMRAIDLMMAQSEQAPLVLQVTIDSLANLSIELEEVRGDPSDYFSQYLKELFSALALVKSLAGAGVKVELLMNRTVDPKTFAVNMQEFANAGASYEDQRSDVLIELFVRRAPLVDFTWGLEKRTASVLARALLIYASQVGTARFFEKYASGIETPEQKVREAEFLVKTLDDAAVDSTRLVLATVLKITKQQTPLFYKQANKKDE